MESEKSAGVVIISPCNRKGESTVTEEKPVQETNEKHINQNQINRKRRRKRKTYLTYKDRVFRMLFTEKSRLLELYNALNNTHYMSGEDLTVNILDNAIYIKMKNDVSFIIDSNMCLFEHQSTYCPNMPLRGFLYFADMYKKVLKDVELSVNRKIKIPKPHYIVFYNGTERKEEEFTQRLSDAYENSKDGKSSDKGCLELIVRTINVNLGKNKELLDKCPSLNGYAYFVNAVRENLKVMEMHEAAARAVVECIENNILRDFFLEQRSEVIAVSIYEYNEEYARKVLREDGYADGYSKGKLEGYSRGESEGYSKGEAEGSFKMLFSLVQDGILSVADAAVRANLTEDAFRDKMQMRK